MLVGGISILIVMGLLLAGVPVAFSFMLSVLYMILTLGYDPHFLLPYSYSRICTLVLLALPLFIIAGGIMERGNVTEPLIDFVDTMVSRVRGGLGAVGIVVNAIFGAISGSSAAAICCIGPILIPRMEKEGYPRGYAAALLTSASGLANLIPPSILLIIYGWLSWTSVTACFLAGVLPGILLMFIFILFNWVMVGRMPMMKPPRPWGKVKQVGREVAHSGWRAFPALMMPVLVLGSIYGGMATPTEAAAAAVFYALILGFFVYRGLTLRELGNILVTSGTTIGAIMIMLFFAMMLGRIYIMEQIPQQIAAFMLNISENKYVMLLMCNVIVFVLGLFIDEMSCMTISVPLLLQVYTQMGVSPVQVAAILTTNTMMGCYTPPMAVMLYIGQRVGQVAFSEMIKTNLALVAFGYMPVLMVVTYWPPLSLWLPKLVLGAL